MTYKCYLCGAPAPQGYMIPMMLSKLHIEVYVCKNCYRKHKEDVKNEEVGQIRLSVES